MFTFLASCPIGTCGPLRDLKANLIICLLAKMNKIRNVRTPPAIIITTVTPESSSDIFLVSGRSVSNWSCEFIDKIVC